MKISYPVLRGVSISEKTLTRSYKCILPNGEILYIGKYFVFDGASIPRLFWSLVGSPFTGTQQRGAFIHDAIYSAEIYDRKTCDWIFLLILKKHNCGWIKRNIIWAAVRAFGGSVWNSHDRNVVKVMKKRIYITME